MEHQNQLPIVAKKFWKIVRVMYFLLRKGISKVKLLAQLHIMMNRSKLAGKLSSIQNLMFHNHHHSSTSTVDNHHFDTVPLNEHPAFPFHLSRRKNRHTPSEDVFFMAALEMAANSASASPGLPGFGQTPMVRQLRITDSPFPLTDTDVDNHVDEAAEDFINKFHRDLWQQNDVA